MFISTNKVMENEQTLLPFSSPTTVYISGPTQAGKSVFFNKLIENADVMFTKPPEKKLYAYSEYQPLFDDIQASNLLFHEGLPDKQKIEEFTQNTKHSLIILGDLISKIVQSEELLHLFAVTSNHKMASVVLISQYLYPPGKYAKSIFLNCANFVLFRNPRDMRQLITFASQILPGMTRYFSDALFLATRERYPYMFVDLSPHREDQQYMLRTGIFPGDTCVVFRPI